MEKLLGFRERSVTQRRDNERTVAKSKRHELFDGDSFFVDEIAADDAKVDRAQADIAWNVIIPPIEDGEREVAAMGEESLPVALKLKSDRVQEIERVLGQTTRALDRELQWQIAGGGKSKRLREARRCFGHRISGTSVESRATASCTTRNQ